MAENKDFQELLDNAKELESINFSETESFDYDKYFNIIEKIASKNQTIKQDEAENVISEFAPGFVDDKFIEELNKRKQSIVDFIRKYDPNSKDIINEMNQGGVDKVYAIFNYLLNSYIHFINEMEFNFELSNAEFKFLNKILTNTIEYNGDDVFNYVEFVEGFWNGAYNEYQSDKGKEKYVFKINIKKILLLHHLIKEFKVKGITSDFKSFRSVLYKIGQTNKIFNAYNIIIERMKEDAKLWGTALDSVLSPEEHEPLLVGEDGKNKIIPITDGDLGKTE
jgi:hypothetical protein